MVPSAPLRAVRPYRLLRLLPGAARQRPRREHRPPASCRASSRARTGSGTTSAATTTTARGWPTRSTIRPTSRCPAQPIGYPRTGAARCTECAGPRLRALDPNWFGAAPGHQGGSRRAGELRRRVAAGRRRADGHVRGLRLVRAPAVRPASPAAWPPGRARYVRPRRGRRRADRTGHRARVAGLARGHGHGGGRVRRAVRRRRQLDDQRCRRRPRYWPSSSPTMLPGAPLTCPSGWPAGESPSRSPSRSRCSCGRRADQDQLRGARRRAVPGPGPISWHSDQPAPGAPATRWWPCGRPHVTCARPSAPRPLAPQGSAPARGCSSASSTRWSGWRAAAVVNACADAPDSVAGAGSSAAPTRLRRCSAAAGAALGHGGSGPDEDCLAATSISSSAGARRGSPGGRCAESLAELQAGRGGRHPGEPLRGEFDRPLYAAHELGYAVALVGNTVAAISAADRDPGGSASSGAGSPRTSSA